MRPISDFTNSYQVMEGWAQPVIYATGESLVILPHIKLQYSTGFIEVTMPIQ
jgi:hypothetical protein